MDLFLHQVLAGLATGGIYACVGLAVVMIYQAIDHLNFAQGEMAMFSTFVAWQLLQWGAPFWVAFVATIALSFAAGVAIERIVFKPIRDAPVLSHVVVFIALLAILNSGAGFIWDYQIKNFPSPFGSGGLFGQTLVSRHDAGMIAVTLMMLALLYLFFRHTRIGLAMRAAAASPDSARLAGMMIAPVVFLEPNMMLSILLYGFAGAVLGGLTSPGGAVLGGFAVGIIENLAATYIPVAGRELKLTIALLIIVAVLVVRPSGLFGRAVVTRV
jgi:branched-chain amino acid transport system permease protein